MLNPNGAYIEGHSGTYDCDIFGALKLLVQSAWKTTRGDFAQESTGYWIRYVQTFRYDVPTVFFKLFFFFLVEWWYTLPNLSVLDDCCTLAAGDSYRYDSVVRILATSDESHGCSFVADNICNMHRVVAAATTRKRAETIVLKGLRTEKTVSRLHVR